MKIPELLMHYIELWLPAVFVVIFAVSLSWGISRFFNSQHRLFRNGRFHRQVMLLVITIFSIFAFILALPLPDTVQNQLLGILGILLTAIIGLSSTTFAANAMAGFMLKLVRNFRKGDFIRVDNYFGRVTTRGLFHTEIQDTDSNLITLPNLYLITHPITTTQQIGTLISACVSLGYDVHYNEIVKALRKAAELTKLDDPFVQMTKLGDFSVGYKVSGQLKNIKILITAESELRKHMFDCLHQADIEIVSPTFMNQRLLKEKIIAEKEAGENTASEVSPESLMFQKADEAEMTDKLEEGFQSLIDDIEKMKSELDSLPEDKKAESEQKIAQKQQQLENLTGKIQKLNDKNHNN